MASSSTKSTGWKYDVFLNFRGADTRNNFTSHLHLALCNKGLDTFIDDQLERGKVISPALLEAIENSRMSILVFSQDYASSTYCLDELVKILECRESKGQTVIPIFYNVNPEEVEKQTGKFGEAFTRHESMEGLEKVKAWKAALSIAASLSGRHLNNGSEASLIQSVVEELYNKLDKKVLHVAEYSVGLEAHMKVMDRILSIGSLDVRVVGIWGTGGIGKTTIAKATFNKFAKEFEGSCFLANVRERSNKYGVSQLQETLLFEILGDKKDLSGNSDLGISVLKARLCSRKVFVIIDDVDDVDQLKKLVGNWLGPGSRVIITTRDKHLLISHRVQMYEVKGLCDGDALQLFSWHAFKKPQPVENYAKLSHCMLNYAGGLPLALVVLGSDLYGRSIPEWESYLRKLKRSPNKQIFEILRISFDGLEDNERAIFLHIACFFKGSYENYVMQVLNACDFEPAWGFPILKEKSLISIEYGQLQMHDLIQSMGWQIVHQESPNIPGKRSRLWRHEDVVPVLTEDMGTHKIEAIMLDLPNGYEEVDLPAKAFAKMKMLRMLVIRNAHITAGIGTLPNELRWLEWPGCPSESLPFTSGAGNLVVLKMPNSLIKQLGVSLKKFRNLESMDFSYCKFLTEIPDLSTIPSLEKIKFNGCTSLVNVHPSIGFLEKLNFLSFNGCHNLKSLPTYFELESLEELHVNNTKLEKLPNFKNFGSLKRMNFKYCIFLTEIPDLSTAPNLETMDCEGCISLIRIHPSLGFLEKLETLSFLSCSNLASIPSCFKPRSLQRLYLNGCTKLEELPNTMEYMACLKELYLDGTAIKELPPSIEFLSKLQWLFLSNCKNLTTLPSSIYNLDNLWELRLENCSQLSKFPEITVHTTPSRLWNRVLEIRYCNLSDLEFLKSFNTSWLRHLDLSGNSFAGIPSCISKFTGLQEIYLCECQWLREIPELPMSVVKVVASNCKSLERFSQLTLISQFSHKEERLHEVSLGFSNCHKLADSEDNNFENLVSYYDITSLKPFIVVLPGGEILPWFHYKSEEDSLSFQLPSSVAFPNIKAVLFCIIIASGSWEDELEYEVHINGRKVGRKVVNYPSRRYFKSEQSYKFESDHMLFGKLLPNEDFLPWPRDFDLFGASVTIRYYVPCVTVTNCGAYVVFKEDDDHSESYDNLGSESDGFVLSDSDDLSIEELKDTNDDDCESNEDSELHGQDSDESLTYHLLYPCGQLL